MDDDQHPHESTPRSGDDLDQLFVPRLGLSLSTMVAIFVGGAVGTVARYELDARHPIAPGHFPWVTLLINLSGSFAIGLLVPLTEFVTPRAPLARPLLIVGFLGGWTTYSTLAVEATLLAKDGAIADFVTYLVATVVGGLALVVVGTALGRRMVPA
jgi:fluoride exporter